ncbi:MAG: helix-hairpin-helix domain-containing protein [Candidatus Methanomethylophilaceae archaeon]
MVGDIKVVLIDGYIDDPAALGVPPYISPMVRAVAGAAIDAGGDVEYITIDQIRKGRRIPEAKVSVVLSGNTVPGKYIRSMPMSSKELDSLVPLLKGWKLIGGSAAASSVADRFDFAVQIDLAASLYDGMTGLEVGERYRTLGEWNRWLMLGAGIVRQHQDYPYPLVAEIETYRGCHRYSSGGCSYCIEPLKGKPLMRSEEDILAEAGLLRSFGIRNVRIGGQTCIMSYGSEDDSGVPRPEPEKISKLFNGLKHLDFDVLHVDNANPAVISEYPEESEKILRTLVDCCTPGNVLALGMESADINVINSNNLNSMPDQVLTAVRLINKVGSERGSNGMPKLLPGLNFIAGLDGETEDTYRLNRAFLQRLVDEGLMLRRINIRQVLPIRREFNVRVNPNLFKKYKQDIRENIDAVMLERIAPRGTVLKDVFMELRDGGITFGRQIGTYPLLVGVPYPLEVGKVFDLIVTDWGFRSITGIEHPFRINEASMAAIASLPGIGKKRSANIVRYRPYTNFDEFSKIMDDADVLEGLRTLISFD